MGTINKHVLPRKQTFCGVKYVVMLQVVDGHAPEGVLHVEVSIVDPGFCRFDGKLAR